MRWSITSHTTLNDGLYAYDAIGGAQAAATTQALARWGRPGARPPSPESAAAAAAAAAAGEEPPIGEFVRLGPLGTAFLPTRLPRVLLIDELDKSDVDLPNDLLSIFEDGQFTIPELARVRNRSAEVTVFTDDPDATAIVVDGRTRCHASPMVVITSNGEREFPEAFLRRCVRLEIRPPDAEQLAAMVTAHLRDLDDERRPSRRAGEVSLDEEATAERAVQDGLWWPVTKPDTTRWLNLTLVVDTSPSMVLWQSSFTAFGAALEQLGAFRTIQRHLLSTHRSPVLRGGTPATPPRSPAELVDMSGRRIVLCVHLWSRCVLAIGIDLADARAVGPVHAGDHSERAVAATLAPWGMGVRRARVRVPRLLAANRHWALEFPDDWLEPDPASVTPASAVAVPVLELQARWLSRWAELVTGNRTQPVDATVMLAGDQSRDPTAAQDDIDDDDDVPISAEPSARQRVRNFLSTASPPASRLATLLAAVPVSLPVARLVQATLVPESGPDHLAEVFTSGLLQPREGMTDTRAWDTASFDIADSVREVLLRAPDGRRPSTSCGLSPNTSATRSALSATFTRHWKRPTAPLIPHSLRRQPARSQSQQLIPQTRSFGKDPPLSTPPCPKPSGSRLLWLLVAVLFSLIVALVTGILKSIADADLANATLAGGAAFAASMALCLGTLTAMRLL